MKRPISLFIMIFLLSLIGSYHIYYSLINYVDNIETTNLIEEIEEKTEEQGEVSEIIEDDPLGVIDIPKISVKRVFYPLNSKKNNVNENITILEGSSMPNTKSSYLILAAHSGNSYLGFFKNLSSLSLGDEINIYYYNNRYLYYIDDIYELPKNKKISFIKNDDENILVLTTCSKDNKQLVIVAKMQKYT